MLDLIHGALYLALVATSAFGSKNADAILEVEPLERERVRQITESTRDQALDIEFFNLFYGKNEYPTDHRVQKLNALASEDFEPAIIALQLFDFGKGGIPRAHIDPKPALDKLDGLAKAGNLTAMCLYAQVVAEYVIFDLPGSRDKKIRKIATEHHHAAAQAGHPYCGLHGGWKDEEERRNGELHCARAGAVFCQRHLANRHFSNTNNIDDQIRGLCWLKRARDSSDQPSIEGMLRLRSGSLARRVGKERLSTVMETWTHETDCERVGLDAEPHRESPRKI